MDETCMSQDLINWLVLIRSPGLSPVKRARLFLHFGTAERLVNSDPDLLREMGISPETIDFFRSPRRQDLEKDLAWLDDPDNHFIRYTDAAYPTLLRNIPDPPPGLFVSGRRDILENIQVAVVGTRKPSPGGKRIALDFAMQLGNSGISITSGLAVGIDTAAHEGALGSVSPTLAVLGHGPDTVYPASNRLLAEKIRMNGALVSEFPPGCEPKPAHFPRRNRIISGLSVGTLVVEAAVKSGSLITARLAMEQGREVFAVPGSIHNPVSAGCHTLISDGAKLTTKIEDILEEIGPLSSVTRECETASARSGGSTERLDGEGKLLLDNIGYEPVGVDELVDQTGLPVRKVSVLLLELELEGLIDSLPGGRVART